MLLWFAMLLSACDGPALEDDDQDGDGYVAPADCDDSNANIHPDAQERCDRANLDDDCDGKADSDDDDAEGRVRVYPDADDDGFGSEAEVLMCEVVDGYVDDNQDCDDNDNDVHPLATEVCDASNTDEDCDGLVNDDDDSVHPNGFIPLYQDDDEDGYGSETETEGCAAGRGQSEVTGDCDDHEAAISPEANEICGGGDENCDGEENEASAADAPIWYADEDGDGYGTPTSSSVACVAPRGYVASNDDCVDFDRAVHPGANELCNDADDDCDGTPDDNPTNADTWYEDVDGDNYGDPRSTAEACDRPSGYAANNDDCDDADAARSPAADEVCDAADVDEDCDGDSDDDDNSTGIAGRIRYFSDDDNDGYGDPDAAELLCDEHPRYVIDDTDCDDSDSAINPAGTEVCDNRDEDEDCDGFADDDDSSVLPSSIPLWFLDLDGDDFGDAANWTAVCDAPVKYVEDDTDCDDSDADRNPGESEVCDAANLDEDCDDLSDDDDASTRSTGKKYWFEDADSDGYGTESGSTYACDAPSGYTSESDDCDDGEPEVNPDAVEVCYDAVDDDCDDATRCTFAASYAERLLFGDDRFAGNAGGAVASAGDLNGDGIEELLIGAPADAEGGTSAGKASIAYGGTSSSATPLRTEAHANWRGEPISAYAGYALSGARDYSGDGVSEIAVGVYRDTDAGSDAGSVFLLSGATTGTNQITSTSAYAQLLGAGADEYAGYAVDHAGDTNGDGNDDLIVGAPALGRGKAYVVTSVSAGSQSLGLATLVATGEVSGDYAGVDVSSAGDTDGDGFDDVLIGAYHNDAGGSQSGATYLVLGPASGALALTSADAKVKGGAASDESGLGLCGGGDIDGDGKGDFVIGAQGAGTAGKAYVFVGGVLGTVSVTTADATLTGSGSTGKFGASTACNGDMDGDGYSEVAVSNTAETRSQGSASVFFGPLSGIVADTAAGLQFTGESDADYLGYSLAFVGDQSGDPGLSDLLVGATGEDTAASAAGAAYVFSAD